jgi:predicted component of type VI protein secretion system
MTDDMAGMDAYDHWKKKDFSEEMLVYWTYLEMPNRQAKYVEQLLLDLFKIPFNKSESRGTQTLCAYLTQNEVD